MDIGFELYSNLSWYTESLYKTKRGDFFLFGEGGPASKYREVVSQNCWCEGEKIIPLQEDEAREWAEKVLNADEYEEVFGAVEE